MLKMDVFVSQILNAQFKNTFKKKMSFKKHSSSRFVIRLVELFKTRREVSDLKGTPARSVLLERAELTSDLLEHSLLKLESG